MWMEMENDRRRLVLSKFINSFDFLYSILCYLLYKNNNKE